MSVTDANECAVQATAEVPLVSGILANVDSMQPASCLLNDGLLQVSASGGTSPYAYRWSNGAQTETACELAPGTYTVTITDINQCSEALIMQLNRADCPQDVLWPTAFSPNGDGINDLFRPVFYTAPEQLNWKIYNRWGNLIYEGSGAKSGWDGTFQQREAELGVYIWYAEILQQSGVKTLMRGNLTLLR